MASRFIVGSAHDLSALADGTIHAAMFSPPYFGLRSYHGDQGVEWPEVSYCPMPGLPALTVPAMQCALGDEPTIEAYIGHMMLVLREVWRVLRDDGTCWVNLGDSYNNRSVSRPSSHQAGLGFDSDHLATSWRDLTAQGMTRLSIHGLKEKDLMLVPARFALAAQSEGWWVRNDIIWAKGVSFNPVYSGVVLPDPTPDRFTRSHEYVWLLAKAKRYFFDQEAVREPPAAYNRKGGSATYTANGSTTHGVGSKSLHQMSADGRNPRTVWTINPKGYPGSHFATWPAKLVEPMILAATSARGVCPTCGAPWKRVMKKAGFEQEAATLGWIPTCNCYFGGEYLDGDFEMIATPIGYGQEDDPSLETGRAGFNRPRKANEGRRMTTRFEQRRYAVRLQSSPYRQQMSDEVGATTFAHYIRIDRAGARPVPVEVLERWIAAGWVERVEVPAHIPPLIDIPEMPEDAIGPAVCEHCKGTGVEELPLLAETMPCPQCKGKPISLANDAWLEWRAAADEAQANIESVLRQIEAMGDLPAVPATVLDVFSGSGTTGMVAAKLGRDYVGVDINGDYHDLAAERLNGTQKGMFVDGQYA